LAAEARRRSCSTASRAVIGVKRRRQQRPRAHEWHAHDAMLMCAYCLRTSEVTDIDMESVAKMAFVFEGEPRGVGIIVTGPEA
jgi:hypothetical protein